MKFHNPKYLASACRILILFLFSILIPAACSQSREKESVPTENRDTKVHPTVYKEVDCHTPNIAPGKNEVKGIVLHHTANPTLDEDLRILSSPDSKVSCHVLIAKDGTRYLFAYPEEITWHAGFSYLNGREKANNFTIGIEFQGNTVEEPLTDDQIRSAIAYMKPIMEKYSISQNNVVTHEQIRTAWKKRHPKSNVPDKVDITPDEYKHFMNALNDSIISWKK